MALKLFIPCFLDQCASPTAAAVAALLERLGISFDYPEDQTCCGQFAYTLGDPATTRLLLRHYLRVFAGARTILCPSASCTHMVRSHFPQLAQTSRERDEAEAAASRTLELSEYLDRLGPLPWTPRFEGSLVLHRSCKARQLEVLPGALRVLSQVAGLRILEVSPHFSCCGFGGIFSLRRPDLAREIAEAYLEAVRATGAQGLVSLDYSCLLHLRAVAATRGWDLQFWHLVDILSN